MARLNLIDREDCAHRLEALESWGKTEILRGYKVGINGICGAFCYITWSQGLTLALGETA